MSGCVPVCTSREVRSLFLVTILLLTVFLWLHFILIRKPPINNVSHTLNLSTVEKTIQARQIHFPQRRSPYLTSGVSQNHLAQDPKKPLLVLHWTEQPGFYFHVNNSSFSGCPVSSCSATSDRKLLSIADAVVIHGHRINMSNLPSRKRPHKPYVLVWREAPPQTPSRLPLRKLDGYFDLMMAYTRDADVLFPYGLTGEGKQTEKVPPFNASRGVRPVAWMVSHCKTVCKREQYVAQLRHHIAVDTFGKCGERRCPEHITDCYRHLAETHLFYLSFENSLCDDYITEKFWLALQAGMVPVVRGPSPQSYHRVAPPNSFIHVEEFAGPKALAAHLLALSRNQTAYEEYHAWRSSHKLQYPRPMCNLCHRLHYGDRQKQLHLSKLWSVADLCHEPRDLDEESSS
ncbi:alpha-(1,3)-fucosyltransferase 7-like isoform X1 [Amphibalanus amphitrite]|uniref:alpha-(1,3)-fucosyltransferase 7-like isoform X1 n=1 Tax=Amphibalanus amphitrite TaxID=1232801 RepID=UPI001C911828|nr:alpha-(1,3)-fucosyltransferase 7-like isoform X1 [Amphibalanus amphitrite]XP_043210818.1 alpha-(1,3)-fucosyltransferase 7-like isoform X1 [Amphibalanus amphitrite]